MGEPQTLREAAQAVVKAWEGDAQPLAVTLENVEIAMRALRAALASSDSLRLDPEDPDSVEPLRPLVEAASRNGEWDPEYVRWAIRHISRNVDFPDHLHLPETYEGWEYMGYGDRPYHADADLIVAAVNYVRSRLAHTATEAES